MFDPRTELANDHGHNFDPIGPLSDSHDTWGAINFGAKSRKTAQNYENYRNWKSGGVQFRHDNSEDESGVCSPPLWRTSPPRSPSHRRRPQNNYRYLSPNSRTQDIVRGQWELMEMVKNMPESSYELSLKDIVEQPILMESREENLEEERNIGREIAYQRVKVKREESKKIKGNVMRSGSFDNRGLFLKMSFPISLGSKKKNSTNSGTNSFGKVVLPKIEGSERSSSKSFEKEYWWKKRFSGSSESESGVTSSNSGSTGSSGSSGSSSSSRSNSSRKNSGCFLGCLPFFYSNKSKSAK